MLERLGIGATSLPLYVVYVAIIAIIGAVSLFSGTDVSQAVHVATLPATPAQTETLPKVVANATDNNVKVGIIDEGFIGLDALLRNKNFANSRIYPHCFPANTLLSTPPTERNRKSQIYHLLTNSSHCSGYPTLRSTIPQI